MKTMQRNNEKMKGDSRRSPKHGTIRAHSHIGLSLIDDLQSLQEEEVNWQKLFSEACAKYSTVQSVCCGCPVWECRQPFAVCGFFVLFPRLESARVGCDF